MVFLLLISLLLALIDQLFKYLVVNNIKPIGGITVIDGFLSFTYVENKGAALGILRDHRWIFMVITVLILLMLIYIVIKWKVRDKLFLFSVVLIIGGGIGNLIDRIFLGYVIDYIYFWFFPPVCNFADYCVSVGTVLLIIYVFFYKKDKNCIDKEKR